MLLVCITLFLLSCTYNSQAELTLELASVVFRHGDRSPIRTFPTDKFPEPTWPQGYGQLSITGMQQHEQLGGLLQDRYVTTTFPNFLHSNYTRVQVSVRSTDVDRTLMSGASMLSALFPPDQTQRFNDSLGWQPIPIHTVAVERDWLLRGYDNCPAYSKLREADKTTKEYQQIERDNKDFFVMVARETGLSSVNLTNIWSIQDTIFIENITEGKGSPEWATAEVMAKMEELAAYSLSIFFNTRAKNRLSAGVWLGKILGDMKSKANGTNTQSKLFLYSAHDTTVACMMSALGLYDKTKPPPYATAFLVELFSDEAKNYYIRFSLRVGPNSTTFTQLEMPQCNNADKMCSLSEFEQFVQPLIPNDIEQECSVSSPSSGPSSLSVAFGLVTTAAVIIIIVLMLVIIVMHMRRRKYSYDSQQYSTFNNA